MSQSKTKLISFASLMLVLFSCSTPSNIQPNETKEIVKDLGFEAGGSASIKLSFNKNNKFGIKTLVDGFTSSLPITNSKIVLKLHKYNSGDTVPPPKDRFENIGVGVEVASIDLNDFSSNTSVTFKGLQPNKKYYISARAYTDFESPTPSINVLADNSDIISTGSFANFNLRPTDIIRLGGTSLYTLKNVLDPSNIQLNTTVSMAGNPYSFEFKRNIVGVGDIGDSTFTSKGMASTNTALGGGTAPAKVFGGNEEYIEVQASGNTIIQNDSNTNNILDIDIQLMKDIDAISTGNISVVNGLSPSAQTERGFSYYHSTSQERVINDTRDKDNSFSDISHDGNGNMAFVWEINTKDDGLSKGIYFKRIGSDGFVNQAETDELVNTTISGEQTHPQIKMATNKKIAIVWEGKGGTDNNGIFFKRYEPNVTTNYIENIDVTEKTLIDASAEGDEQKEPSMAMDKSTGDFVVTWTDKREGNYDIYLSKVQMSSGTFLPNIKVNSTNTFTQSDSQVSITSSGNFVVTWVDERSGNKDIYARRLSDTGTPIGNEFLVNTTISGNQQNPSISINNNGEFVITWEDLSGVDSDIKAQLFNSSGMKIGEEFLVNNYTSGVQSNPKVQLVNNNCIITWNGETDASTTSKIAMREFITNTTITPYFFKPIDNQVNISSDQVIGPAINSSFEVVNNKMITTWSSVTSQTINSNNNIMFKLLSKGF